VTKVIDEVRGTFKDVKNKLFTALGKIWVIPLSALAFWLFCRITSPVVQALLIPVFAAIFGVYWVTVKPVFAAVEKQSGGSPLATALCSLLSLVYLPKDASKLPGEILRRMGTLPKASEGVEVFIKGVLSCVEGVINYILKSVGKTQISFGDESRKAIRAWVEEAEAVEVAIRALDSADPDIKVVQKLEAVIRRSHFESSPE
jgi:hypothetical protein